eukprot:TRINITY_DN13091_c0_g1_i3.p2 TRINITY_DN13091_c0_g1~~TRINITY_DN13091_c0_g1_i3.p2  ORF type:complete len:113 (-),score=7.44 TRINITY_DN13091_c0_g1_i3:306-644(-)
MEGAVAMVDATPLIGDLVHGHALLVVDIQNLRLLLHRTNGSSVHLFAHHPLVVDLGVDTTTAIDDRFRPLPGVHPHQFPLEEVTMPREGETLLEVEGTGIALKWMLMEHTND